MGDLFEAIGNDLQQLVSGVAQLQKMVAGLSDGTVNPHEVEEKLDFLTGLAQHLEGGLNHLSVEGGDKARLRKLQLQLKVTKDRFTRVAREASVALNNGGGGGGYGSSWEGGGGSNSSSRSGSFEIGGGGDPSRRSPGRSFGRAPSRSPQRSVSPGGKLGGSSPYLGGGGGGGRGEDLEHIDPPSRHVPQHHPPPSHHQQNPRGLTSMHSMPEKMSAPPVLPMKKSVTKTLPAHPPNLPQKPPKKFGGGPPTSHSYDQPPPSSNYNQPAPQFRSQGSFPQSNHQPQHYRQPSPSGQRQLQSQVYHQTNEFRQSRFIDYSETQELAERNQELSEVAQDMHHIKEYFEEAGEMIEEQAEMVDTVEQQTEQADLNSAEAIKNLSKAKKSKTNFLPAAGAAVGGAVFGVLGTVVAPGVGTVGGLAAGAGAGAVAGHKLNKLMGKNTDKDLFRASLKDKWVPDNLVTNCTQCNKAFGTLKRKHHCRVCGNIFCSDCLKYKIQLPDHEFTGTVKVCQTCHHTIVYGVADVQ